MSVAGDRYYDVSAYCISAPTYSSDDRYRRSSDVAGSVSEGSYSSSEGMSSYSAVLVASAPSSRERNSYGEDS